MALCSKVENEKSISPVNSQFTIETSASNVTYCKLSGPSMIALLILIGRLTVRFGSLTILSISRAVIVRSARISGDSFSDL